MSLTDTEKSILKVIAETGKTTPFQINHQTGLSLGYVEYLCGYLVRKGYLKTLGHGSFALAPKGKTMLVDIGYGLGLDKESIRDLASQVAKEVAKKIKIKGGLRVSRAAAAEEEEKREKIQIKTDYSLPVEDETVKLESNLDRMGAKLEKEESDIDKSVELFRKMQKKHRPKDKGKK